MRIGVVGPPSADMFAHNVLVTLRSMGHDAVALGASRPRVGPRPVAVLAEVALHSPAVDRAYQRRMVDQARRRQLDLVITVESTLQPDTVAALQQGGARVVLWFPDHLANLDRQLMFVSPYDAVFFKDPLLVERLRALLDLPVHYLPEACNPMWHRPTAKEEAEPFLVIAGNVYPSRLSLLVRLHRAGVPLRLYGATSGTSAKWLARSPVARCHTGEVIVTERKAAVYRQAAGVLNNLHPSELAGVNCRLFEAAGSGAAVLCESRPALPELFEPGREVLAFSSFDELVDQARRLLDDHDLGTKLGDAAAARAHADHTYERRLERLLSVL